MPTNGSLRRSLVSVLKLVLLSGLGGTLAVSAVFVYHLAINFRSDTTPVTNGAFLITGTLCALCFAWVQALLPDDADRPRVLFAGERLLHTSIFLIVASILKYAALTLSTYRIPDVAQGFIRALADVFGVLAALLFLFSVIGAYVGIVTLYRILWPRTSRHFQ
jgi:hypothetical protein